MRISSHGDGRRHGSEVTEEGRERQGTWRRRRRERRRCRCEVQSVASFSEPLFCLGEGIRRKAGRNGRAQHTAFGRGKKKARQGHHAAAQTTRARGQRRWPTGY